MKLADLEQQTGVPARGIRFLIAEHVLPAPEGNTRGAEYDERHLRGLQIYLEMKDQGERSLKVIGDRVRAELNLQEFVTALAPAAGIELTIDWATAGQFDPDEAAEKIREALVAALAGRQIKEPV